MTPEQEAAWKKKKNSYEAIHREKNRERIREAGLRHYHKNKDFYKQQKTEARKINPEKFLASARANKAKIYADPTRHELEKKKARERAKARREMDLDAARRREREKRNLMTESQKANAKAKNKIWLKKNADRVAERAKIYKSKDPERVRQRLLNWRIRNPNRAQEYYKENRDRIVEYHKKRNETNRAQAAADQFFIMAGAAESLTNLIKPNKKTK